MGDPGDPLLSLNETPSDSIESWIQMEMKLDWEWQNSTWIYIYIYLYTVYIQYIYIYICIYHWDLLTQKPVVGNRVLAHWDSHRCPKRGFYVSSKTCWDMPVDCP